MASFASFVAVNSDICFGRRVHCGDFSGSDVLLKVPPSALSGSVFMSFCHFKVNVKPLADLPSSIWIKYRLAIQE